MHDLHDFIQDFVVECSEGLERLDQELVHLEVAPDDPARLDRIFRTLHTIKGNCGFLEFRRLGALAHAGETLLSRLRERRLHFEPQIADALLQLVDATRRTLAAIRETGQEGDADFTPLIAWLLRLSNAASPPRADSPRSHFVPPRPPVPDSMPASEPSPAELPPAAVLALPPAAAVQHAAPSTQLPNADRSPLGAVGAPSFSETSDVSGLLPALASEPDAAPTPSSDSAFSLNRTPPAVSFAGQSMAGDGSGSSYVSNSGIRIDVSLLDRLMNLVGELVLARNRIVQYAPGRHDPNWQNMTQRLNLITSELQEEFMKTRMQRIGVLWQRFPRVVRDAARQCGKNVRLLTVGAETKLDRTLVEAIAEPLTHTLRNAVAHGIESPHERRRRGKPEQGTITLRAFHQAGQVQIEISDDGAGIDFDKVRRQAVKAGFFSGGESEVVGRSKLLEALFRPGFTTSDDVNDLAGRGVGLDVVKTRIEQAGGSVLIDTEPGAGTTFRLTVPLTLAIIPALIVRCGACSYAVPQVSLSELRRMSADDLRRDIEVVHDGPVLKLRGRLVPLVWLRDVLGLPSAPAGADASVLVLHAADRVFALVVDAVTNNEEIVVKPLPVVLHGVPAYSGNTLLGDGTLALILDVLGLARLAGVFAQNLGDLQDETAPPPQSSLDLATGLLVCDASPRRRVAIPLAHVLRLDEISRRNLEWAGRQLVCQQDGGLLPLIDVAATLYDEAGTLSEADRGSWPIVVCTTAAGEIGCVVSRVLDVAPAPDRMQETGLAGIQGAAALGQRVTDVLDLRRLAAREPSRATEA